MFSKNYFQSPFVLHKLNLYSTIKSIPVFVAHCWIYIQGLKKREYEAACLKATWCWARQDRQDRQTDRPVVMWPYLYNHLGVRGDDGDLSGTSYTVCSIFVQPKPESHHSFCAHSQMFHYTLLIRPSVAIIINRTHPFTGFACLSVQESTKLWLMVRCLSVNIALHNLKKKERKEKKRERDTHTHTHKRTKKQKQEKSWKTTAMCMSSTLLPTSTEKFVWRGQMPTLNSFKIWRRGKQQPETNNNLMRTAASLSSLYL